MDEDSEIQDLEENIINEAKINGNYIPLKAIEKNKKAICQIIINERIKGTGFFCQIKSPIENKTIKVLLTCYHVLDIEDQAINRIVCKIENEEKTLDLENRWKRHDRQIDFTCVQIINEDNIEEFLEIDENILANKLKKFKRKKIYTIGFSEIGGIDTGEISRINEKLFVHNCSTEHGWSGGPIFNQENNKVIGLHRGYYDRENSNIGIFINNIINNIEDNLFGDLIYEENSKDCGCSSIYNYFHKYIKKKPKIFIIIVIGLLVLVIILLIILLSDKKEEEENIKKIEDQKEKEYEEEQRENENEEEKKENEKEEEEKRNIEEEYNNEMKIFSDENKGDAYSEITKLLIKENGSYRICVSGAKAKPGGKGGVQCVESYLEKGSNIEYKLGGRKSGGKGGKGCGLFGGDGHNGAGLSYAESSSFLIVAGGGVEIQKVEIKEEILRKKEKENMVEEEQLKILLGKKVILTPRSNKMEKDLKEEIVEVLEILVDIVEGEVEMEIMVEVLVIMEKKEKMVEEEEALIIAKLYPHIKLNVLKKN